MSAHRDDGSPITFGWHSDDATGAPGCPFCHGTGTYYLNAGGDGPRDLVPCDCMAEENGSIEGVGGAGLREPDWNSIRPTSDLDSQLPDPACFVEEDEDV